MDGRRALGASFRKGLGMKRTGGGPIWGLLALFATALAAAPLAANAADSDATPPKAETFAVHGQTTLIVQGAAAFRSPYRGADSLPPNVGRETFDITLYFGLRVWKGGEVWVDPELNQGFSVGNTEGVAGFVNGEGAKLGKTHPYGRIHRWMLRQTIDLGGETQTVDPDQDQLGGAQTANRLVFTIGRISVGDVFDANKYAHDPRNDFLNWALIDTGSFDYAADAWGYTYGLAGEWYQGPWTVRAGAFDMSIRPNDVQLDPTLRQYQLIGEVERRYSMAGNAGKLAMTGFVSHGRMATFADAIALAAATGTVPDVSRVRRFQNRAGVSINLEQQLSDDVGLFARAGIADGATEPFEYADIDQTIAAGVSISGKRWGRGDDTVGVAGILNAISREHQHYLALGGLGILVGDGKLPHPGPEEIVEAYYDAAVTKHVWLTLDAQIVGNPAYNRDRGPAPVLGLRLHAQY
jgi:high affinity Mn2+ porin